MNNWDMMDAGRMKFLPLFYSFNHSVYKEVEYRDLANRAIYPQQLLLHYKIKVVTIYHH